MREKTHSIPEIPDEEMRRRAERIKPVVDFGFPRGKRYIKPVDLHTIAYTWDPKPAGKPPPLKVIKDIRTLHSWGHYALFKPSIGEVLAQIPEDVLDQVIAFEIVVKPECADDLNAEREAVNDGFHVATTRLYARLQ